MIWEWGLEHLSYNNLIKLLNLAPGLRFSDTSPKDICNPYMKKGQQKNINRTEKMRTIWFLAIIYSNIKGPFLPTFYWRKL